MDAWAWPISIAVALLACFVVALLVLHRPVERLLDRTSSAGRNGLTFGPAQERVQEAQETKMPLSLPEAQSPDDLAHLDLMRWPMTATALVREGILRDGLDRYKGATVEEKLSAAIRLLAIARVNLDYTNDAWLITGSQLELLRHLVASHAGVQVKQAEELFKAAYEAFPERWEGATFDIWLGWLLRVGFVQEREDRLHITPYGEDFLKFLVDAKMVYTRGG